MVEPKVSVITITYNHGSFIGKAIEGVLSQKTDFSFEHIIAEDCSTDNTRDIIRQYAEKYPSKIRVITSESNVGAVVNETRALQQAKGKYIAFCEGDDYWTDPHKLQKQVDFLEKNPDFSVCFHRFRNYDVKNKVITECRYDNLFVEKNETGYTINSHVDFLIEPLPLLQVTMVYRKDSFDLSLTHKYKYYRDFHLFYHILKEGKGYIFPFYGAMRHLHEGGICHRLTEKERLVINILITKEFFKVSRANDVKQYYIKVLQDSIYSLASESGHLKQLLLLSFKLFIVQKSFRRLGANCKRIIQSIL